MSGVTLLLFPSLWDESRVLHILSKLLPLICVLALSLFFFKALPMFSRLTLKSLYTSMGLELAILLQTLKYLGL